MNLNTTEVRINGIWLNGIGLIEKARPRLFYKGKEIKGVKSISFRGLDGKEVMI